MRPRPRPISSVIALLLIAARAAEAQDAAAAAPPEVPMVELDAVIALGTSRSDATALTSTAPVDVLTPQDLRQTGAVTLNQALSRLHPSFNFPQGQNAVKGQGVRAASLRGVGPAYTLVLVNGKRRNVSAQLSGTDPWPAAQVVDINTIPVSAVERVEVLRDGAAAQYGSDAIAGVINIVLRKDAHGGELAVRGGGYGDGGGETLQIAASKGLDIAGRGFVNLAVDRLKNDNVDRSEADWRQLFPTGDPRNETFDAKYGQWGQSQRSNWAVLANAGLDIGAGLAAYGWVSWADKSASNWVNPERVVKANTQSPTATNPSRVSETAVLDVYPDGYQPYMTYVAEDAAAVAGLTYEHGALGELDLGVSYGENETGRSTFDSINPSWGPDSARSFYLGSWRTHTTSVTLDFVRDVPLPWTRAAVLSAGALHRDERWATADLGDPQGYTSGPLGGRTLAALYGAGGPYAHLAPQYPTVNFGTDNSVVPATGSSTAGIQPLDAGGVSRDVNGGYLGLDVRLGERLDVGLTGRHEHYSDFGATSNHRLTARYEILPAVALRGTVSSGFHAPSLAQIGQQSTGYTSTFTNNGSSVLTPGRTRQFRANDPVAAAFGARPLQPEESTTYSLGLVVRLGETGSLTLDAYRLRIEDVITNTDPIQGPSVTAAFIAAGMPGYTQASYYLNAWDARTDGIDVVARKQLELGGHRFDLLAATSFLNTRVGDVNRQVSVGGTPITVVGNARLRDAESGTPRNKVILGARWNRGPLTAEVTGTRYSSYRYNVGNVPGVATANGNVDQEFSPETYLDLGVSYRLRDHWRVDLLAQNVLNDYADEYVQGNRSSGINAYSFIAPNGASGRFLQGAVSYSF